MDKMNERIKELAEQATSIVEMVGPQGYTSSYANFDREKFAELILLECTQVLFNESERLYDQSTEETNHRTANELEACAENCMNNIAALERHFGIE
jgi:hypothetical protein